MWNWIQEHLLVKISSGAKQKFIAQTQMQPERQLDALIKIHAWIQEDYERLEKYPKKIIPSFVNPKISHPFGGSEWALRWTKGEKDLIIGYTPQGKLALWEIDQKKIVGKSQFPLKTDLFQLIAQYC